MLKNGKGFISILITFVFALSCGEKIPVKEMSLAKMEISRAISVMAKEYAPDEIDEAEKKGIKINAQKLSSILGIPVVETVGRKGRGVYDLFQQAHRVGGSNLTPNIIKFDNQTEEILNSYGELLKRRNVPSKWNYRFLSLKLMEKDALLKPHFENV